MKALLLVAPLAACGPVGTFGTRGLCGCGSTELCAQCPHLFGQPTTVECVAVPGDKRDCSLEQATDCERRMMSCACVDPCVAPQSGCVGASHLDGGVWFCLNG